MSEVVFNNIRSYATGKAKLDEVLFSIINQRKVETGYEDTMKILPFTPTMARHPQQKFTIKVGPKPTPQIVENQNLPMKQVILGQSKGFDLDIFGEKISVTKYFMKWLETYGTISGADASVQQELLDLRTGVRDLMDGTLLRKNINLTRLLTEGWSATNAFGPGSPTPYGQALFSATHPIRQGTDSFYNIVPTNPALTAASLQESLNIHKAVLKTQSGLRVILPVTEYVLCVSRPQEIYAREILNNGSKFSGQGNNAMKENTFLFNGNKVRIEVLPFLGQLNGETGQTIGTDNYWFVINESAMRLIEGMRYIRLFEPEMRTFFNQDNGSYNVNLDFSFSVDHYGAESAIVGSRGDGLA